MELCMDSQGASLILQRRRPLNWGDLPLTLRKVLDRLFKVLALRRTLPLVESFSWARHSPAQQIPYCFHMIVAGMFYSTCSNLPAALKAKTWFAGEEMDWLGTQILAELSVTAL